MKAAFALSIAVVSLLAPVGAFAHHSFAAEYDAKKPITLKGKVSKVEWTNPHARFYIDVKDESGNVVTWNLELASPNVLTRNGWNRHTLNIGDEVTVEGAQAKDGSQMANARTVMLSDGRKVFAFSLSDAPPPDPAK